MLSLRDMKTNGILLKTSIFKFQFGYMKYQIMEKHMTHIEQVTNIFSSSFKEKMRDIKDMLQEKYVLVLSFVMFLNTRKMVVY